MIHGWCLTTKTFNFPEQQGDKIYLHLFFFSKGGSWVGGKTCSWLHNSTTARETNAHKPSWTSLSPWLLLFHVQCIRHHTVLSTPMETSIPSKLWISWGQSEAARIYKVFWEKQPPHLVGNYSLSLMPYHLTKDRNVHEGLWKNGTGQGVITSSKVTHQQWKGTVLAGISFSAITPSDRNDTAPQPCAHFKECYSTRARQPRTTSSSLQLAGAQEYVPKLQLLQGAREGT